eukprot:2667957-Pyramimonas_sp.AAC.1
MQRNTLLSSRVPCFWGLKWFRCGERDVPTPKINGRPGRFQISTNVDSWTLFTLKVEEGKVVSIPNRAE